MSFRVAFVAAVLLAAYLPVAGARGAHPGHRGGFHHAPRVVFAPTPVYYTPVYYVPRTYSYYPPVTYVRPATPVTPVVPPASAAPAPSPYAPASPYSSVPPAQAASQASALPSTSDVYVCKDSNGRTVITSSTEDAANLNCRAAQRASTPVASRGAYAPENATRLRYFCPDSRKYYPEVNTCGAGWLRVMPG